MQQECPLAPQQKAYSHLSCQCTQSLSVAVDSPNTLVRYLRGTYWKYALQVEALATEVCMCRAE